MRAPCLSQNHIAVLLLRSNATRALAEHVRTATHALTLKSSDARLERASERACDTLTCTLMVLSVMCIPVDITHTVRVIPTCILPAHLYPSPQHVYAHIQYMKLRMMMEEIFESG